jgi:hypothetical protein
MQCKKVATDHTIMMMILRGSYHFSPVLRLSNTALQQSNCIDTSLPEVIEVFQVVHASVAQ